MWIFTSTYTIYLKNMKKVCLNMAKAKEKLITDLLTKISGVCSANGGVGSVGIDIDGYALPGKQIPPNPIENLHSGEFFFHINETYMEPLREVFEHNHVKEYVFYPISELKTELFSTPEIPELQPIHEKTKESLHHNIEVMKKFLSRFKDDDWKPFLKSGEEDKIIHTLFEESGALNFYPVDGVMMLMSAALFPKLTKNNIKDMDYVYYKPSETLNLGGCVFRLKHTHFTLYYLFCFVILDNKKFR